MKCPVCKNDFNPDTGRRPKKFCSDTCKVKFWNVKKKVKENNKPENKARIEAERNAIPNHIAAINPLGLGEAVQEKEAIQLQLQEYEKELTVLGDSAVAQKRKRWVTDKIYDLKFKLNQLNNGN